MGDLRDLGSLEGGAGWGQPPSDPAEPKVERLNVNSSPARPPAPQACLAWGHTQSAQESESKKIQKNIDACWARNVDVPLKER